MIQSLSTLIPHWDDRRCHTSGMGTVFNSHTGEEYGSLTKDSNIEIRLKLLGIAVMVSPLGVVLTGMGIVSLPVGLSLSILGVMEAVARIFTFLGGDFIPISEINARNEWVLIRFNDMTRPVAEFQNVKRKCLLKAVVKGIVQIVTIPFLMIGLTFAALYGTFIPLHRAPLDARAMVANLFSIWARQVILIDDKDDEIFRMTDFFAPCMLSKSQYTRWNLYRWEPGVKNPESIRSRLVRLSNGLNGNPKFWQKMLARREVTAFKRCLRAIENCRQNMKGISWSDENEGSYSEKDDKRLSEIGVKNNERTELEHKKQQDEWQKTIVCQLGVMEQHLQEIEDFTAGFLKEPSKKGRMLQGAAEERVILDLVMMQIEGIERFFEHNHSKIAESECYFRKLNSAKRKSEESA